MFVFINLNFKVHGAPFELNDINILVFIFATTQVLDWWFWLRFCVRYFFLILVALRSCKSCYSILSDTRDAYTLCVGEIRMLQHKMRYMQLWHSFKIKRRVNVYSEITCLSGCTICNNIISASKWYRFFVLSMLYYIRIDDKSSLFIYYIRFAEQCPYCSSL